MVRIDLDEILRIGMSLKVPDVTNWICSVHPGEEREMLASRLWRTSNVDRRHLIYAFDCLQCA